MIEGTVAQHLEVLRGVPRLGLGVRLVEGVNHAGSFNGPLRHAVDRDRLGYAAGFQDGGHDVDDVAELLADSFLVLDAVGPTYDGPLARAAAVSVNTVRKLLAAGKLVEPTAVP